MLSSSRFPFSSSSVKIICRALAKHAVSAQTNPASTKLSYVTLVRATPATIRRSETHIRKSYSRPKNSDSRMIASETAESLPTTILPQAHVLKGFRFFERLANIVCLVECCLVKRVEAKTQIWSRIRRQKKWSSELPHDVQA
jgi:hypothetical protein